MNERLDKELDAFMDTHNNEVSIDETAEYFYNLALLDVKKELSYRADFFHGRGMGCDNAIEEEMCNIIDFIDNLTK